MHGISEIGIADSVQMFGGAMVGIQYGQQLESLGSALNGITNYDTYVAAPTMKFPGIDKFLERYRAIAEKENLDPLGHFLPPFFYAGGQLIEAAAKGAGSIDEAKLAELAASQQRRHHRRHDQVRRRRQLVGEPAGLGPVSRRSGQEH